MKTLRITASQVLVYRLSCREQGKDPVPYLEFLRESYPKYRAVLDENIREELDFQVWWQQRQAKKTTGGRRMTRRLDYNAGKQLSDAEKSWNALKDIYTWRVHYFDGDTPDFYDHLGTREQALQRVADNVGAEAIISIQRWQPGMPEHELTELEDES